MISDVLYNDVDPFVCAVLRERIAEGWISGTVVERDVRELQPADVAGFRRVHLFAGIGAGELACRLAGWPDDWTLWTGGFPCQDASTANHSGRGVHGERTGLYREFLRLATAQRPLWVVAENVGGLVSRGVDIVIGDFEREGYACWPQLIGAAEVGAPHLRDRLWFVMRDRHSDCREQGALRSMAERSNTHTARSSTDAANAARANDGLRFAEPCARQVSEPGDGNFARDLAHPDGFRIRRSGRTATSRSSARRCGEVRQQRFRPDAEPSGETLADAGGTRFPPPEQSERGITGETPADEWRSAAQRGWWRAEPDVGRVAHGVPARVDRLRALGNAQVPLVLASVLVGIQRAVELESNRE